MILTKSLLEETQTFAVLLLYVLFIFVHGLFVLISC